MELHSNNILFCKTDIIRNKIKNGVSDIVCKHQRTFLSVDCILNFTATIIDILTVKTYGISGLHRNEKCRFWGFCIEPTEELPASLGPPATTRYVQQASYAAAGKT